MKWVNDFWANYPIMILMDIFLLMLCFQDSWVSHETFIPYGNVQCRHQHALQEPCYCLGSKSSQVTSTVLLGKFMCKYVFYGKLSVNISVPQWCCRSKQIESACFSGTSAFMEVRVQSVVVEFILNHVDVLFSPKLSTLIRHSTGEKWASAILLPPELIFRWNSTNEDLKWAHNSILNPQATPL